MKDFLILVSFSGIIILSIFSIMAYSKFESLKVKNGEYSKAGMHLLIAAGVKIFK